MISLRTIKRIATIVVGGTVLAIGVALLVLPGPAFVVIPVGLAILAVEFAWARRLLRKARGFLQRNNNSAHRIHSLREQHLFTPKQTTTTK